MPETTATQLHVKPFLYADDSLVWIEGSPTQVQAAVLELQGIMHEYGYSTGLIFNVAKYTAIL